MTPLKLLIVARRFWPLMGTSENALGSLAVELVAAGHDVTVLTADWQGNGPAMIDFRGVRLVQMRCAPRSQKSTFCYAGLLRRWMRQCTTPFDLAYVAGLKHEAFVAMCVLGDRMPIVLRPELAGRKGDCVWQLDAPFGGHIKRRCLSADALVASTPSLADELKAAGYPRHRIHVLSDGVAQPPARLAKTKFDARRALATANRALVLPDWAQAAVYAGSLDDQEAVATLLEAWEPITSRWPNARLWLPGGAVDHVTLEQQIVARGLTDRVVAAGIFETNEDLLAAADVCITASAQPGIALMLREAMAAGLPVVASDTVDHRSLIHNGRDGLLASSDDAAAFSRAIARVFDEPNLATDLGLAARQHAAEFSLATMVEKHVTLFQELARPLAAHEPTPTSSNCSE